MSNIYKFYEIWMDNADSVEMLDTLLDNALQDRRFAPQDIKRLYQFYLIQVEKRGGMIQC